MAAARRRLLEAFREWFVSGGGDEASLKATGRLSPGSPTRLGVAGGGSRLGSSAGYGGEGAAAGREERDGGEEGADEEEDGEDLDYGERFERMEAVRVTAGNPDSLPFFNAQKAMRTTLIKGGKAKQHMVLKAKRSRK